MSCCWKKPMDQSDNDRTQKLFENKMKGFFRVPRAIFLPPVVKLIGRANMTTYLQLVALAGWDKRTVYYEAINTSLTELSKYLDIPISTLSRTLNLLKRYHLISKEKRTIRINFFFFLFLKTFLLVKGKSAKEQKEIFIDILMGKLQKVEKEFSELEQKLSSERNKFSSTKKDFPLVDINDIDLD